MKTTTLTLYILVLVMLSLGAKAQVTVGSGIPAKAGAILDIKQYDDDVSKAGGRTADKGFMLPRLALTDLNSLADIDPTNTTKRPDPKQHIGLVIYNLTDNTASGGVLQEGTYMWDGEKWQRMGLKDAQGYGPWYRVDDPNLPSRKVDDDSFLEAKVVIGGRLIIDDADLSVHGKTILKGETMIDGQATLGMNAKPTLGSLLDVKSQQAQATTDDNSDDNITSTKGGLLLPRVKLQGTASLAPFLTATEATAEVQASLAGLMVYNLNGTPPLETGIYVWDGTLWLTAGFTKTAQNMSIATQPNAFSFYETGEETPDALEFKVNPPVHIDGSVGTVTYQWYQITGNNIHVRVGTPIGQSGTINGTGATTALFTPTGVIKGNTIDARNNGFYKFYCMAESGGMKIQSDIVEVAVGCGAKNSMGNWISFMCFNLGAGENIGTLSYRGINIEDQKNYNIGAFTNNDEGVVGNHKYIPNEEVLWGDLFQWGRIADGHEKRSKLVAGVPTFKEGVLIGALSINDIENGEICATGTTQRYPFSQVKKGTEWHGEFIISNSNVGYEWNPRNVDNVQLLWRDGQFLPNDPCVNLTKDGTYQEWWSTGIGSTACDYPGLQWRVPSVEDFGAIYRGGNIAGTVDAATVNTWVRTIGNTTINFNTYIEIKPDGVTTTMVLPANGYRESKNGKLRIAGQTGYYHTISRVGAQLQYLSATSQVTPAYTSTNKGYGLGLRCVKYE